MERNIHLPALPGIKQAPLPTDREPTLEDLADHRDAIWSEYKALAEILKSQNINMTTSLITIDGFPRDDIDVAQVRSIRTRMIYLQNDYDAIMGRIEKLVHQTYALIKEESDDSGDEPDEPKVVDQPQTSKGKETIGSADKPGSIESPVEAADDHAADELIPFAKVNSVFPASPSEEAGLVAGDLILSFGPADWTNHDQLKRISRIVQNNEEVAINVEVLRNSAAVRLTLTPRQNWGGRGMLGCHIVPYS